MSGGGPLGGGPIPSGLFTTLPSRERDIEGGIEEGGEGIPLDVVDLRLLLSSSPNDLRLGSNGSDGRGGGPGDPSGGGPGGGGPGPGDPSTPDGVVIVDVLLFGAGGLLFFLSCTSSTLSTSVVCFLLSSIMTREGKSVSSLGP